MLETSLKSVGEIKNESLFFGGGSQQTFFFLMSHRELDI